MNADRMRKIAWPLSAEDARHVLEYTRAHDPKLEGWTRDRDTGDDRDAIFDNKELGDWCGVWFSEGTATSAGVRTGPAFVEAWNRKVTEASICKQCDDTHKVETDRGVQFCLSCPVPCQKCRVAGVGAYCETTPCPCSCHPHRAADAQQPTPARPSLSDAVRQAAKDVDPSEPTPFAKIFGALSDTPEPSPEPRPNCEHIWYCAQCTSVALKPLDGKPKQSAAEVFARYAADLPPYPNAPSLAARRQCEASARRHEPDPFGLISAVACLAQATDRTTQRICIETALAELTRYATAARLDMQTLLEETGGEHSEPTGEVE